MAVHGRRLRTSRERGTAGRSDQEPPPLRQHLRAHLAEAKRLLDEHLAVNPPEYHEPTFTNVRVNREILAAWREGFGDGGDDDEPGRTE